MNRHRQRAARLTKFENGLKGRSGRGKTQNIVEIILLEKFTCRRICFDLWKQEMYHLHSKHTCHVRWKRPKNYISYCSVEINMSLACEYVLSVENTKELYHWKRNMSLALHVSMSRWRDVLRLALLHPPLVSKPNGICLSPAVTQNI